jgi:hypothetical protein
MSQERPPKPDPYLTAYIGTLTTLFGLWRLSSAPVERGFETDADDDEITPHLDYLQHVLRAAAATPAPAGGEAVHRILVSIMQSQIDQFRAVLAEDAEAHDQHGRDLLEDFTVFEVALEELSRKAEIYKY